MRSLIDVWPEFAEGVDFYAVNIDPSDSFDKLEDFKLDQGYPWPLTHSDRDTLLRLNVIRQSTKIAFDSDGVIVYRERMGGGDTETWRDLFRELSEEG
ncbi:MAG: peroxiredoxin family protein [Dehalococcoidia bacterium]|nr:peroxiredoxin family protein [Dehalococcoidia bacterium]